MHLGRYRVRPGDERMLATVDPADTQGFSDKDAAAKRIAQGLARLATLQERLYASDRYALLLILQGLDAAGKDSAIGHVFSGVNPQGTSVHAFQAPTPEELAHDFLWRAACVLPARGHIGIFNRSYYEDVVTVRVRPTLIADRHLPADRLGHHLWNGRFEDIRGFERHLDRNATIVRKVFLHVSRREQRARLLQRLETPSKRGKLAMSDLADRARWRGYQRAWGEAIAATSRAEAPWFVVPADHKWFAHLVLAEILIDTLGQLDLSMGRPDAARRRDLRRARRLLTSD